MKWSSFYEKFDFTISFHEVATTHTHTVVQLLFFLLSSRHDCDCGYYVVLRWFCIDLVGLSNNTSSVKHNDRRQNRFFAVTRAFLQKNIGFTIVHRHIILFKRWVSGKRILTTFRKQLIFLMYSSSKHEHPELKIQREQFRINRYS